MPSAIVTLPDGRRAKLTGPTREAIMAQAQRLTDPDLAIVDQLMAGKSTGRPVEPNIADKLRSIKREQSIPLVGGTLASMAFPPLAAGRAAPLVQPMLTRVGLGAEGLLGLLARGGRRFGPTVAAAGGGGAAGGGLLEASEGGSPEEVLRAASRSGLEMAAGEAAGLGAGAALARVAAPALGHMTDVGRRAIQFARETGLPGSVRAITGRETALPLSPADVAPGAAQKALQGIVDTLLPSRFVAQSRRRAVVARVLEAPVNEQNEVLRRLVRLDTSDAQLPRQIQVAERIARALGAKQARTFGFYAADTGPRRFISRVFENGDAAQIRRLQRMGARQLDEALTVNLAGLIERSTIVDSTGRRLIAGDRLLTAWNNLPDQARSLYPEATREAVENFAAYAAVSRRVPELAAQPTLNFQSGVLTTGAGIAPQMVAGGLGAAADLGTPGIGAGIAVLTARSLMSSRGWLNRWLTNEKLPPELVQAIGGQATRFETRRRSAGLLDDEVSE